MKKQKNLFFRWFSINRHRRRSGAADVMEGIRHADLQAMRTLVVNEGGTGLPAVTSGGAKEIKTHLENLRQQFTGQSEIAYYHAVLIVLIRREADVRLNYQRFRQLWDEHADFLVEHLSVRWLVSACDTFIDHDENPVVQSLMMAAVLLINTVKLQETERLFERSEVRQVDAQILGSLNTSQVLFDGLSPFAVGQDDTLRNMRWRLDRVCKQHSLGIIPLAVFERLQREDNPNVYSRFKQIPMKKKTEWWA